MSQQRSSNSALDLGNVAEEQGEPSELPVQLPVVTRRSSVETKEKAELVRLMQLKRKKCALDLQLEQARSRERRRSISGPRGSTSRSMLEERSSAESEEKRAKQKMPKTRKTATSPWNDPNCVGYRPRRSHRHEHQAIRAKELENYSMGLPRNTGDSSDEYSR